MSSESTTSRGIQQQQQQQLDHPSNDTNNTTDQVSTKSQHEQHTITSNGDNKDANNDHPLHIDTVGLFGDIFNAITEHAADSIDDLEKRLNKLHDEYIESVNSKSGSASSSKSTGGHHHMMMISPDEVQYQKSVLSKGLNQMYIELERATNLYIDQAEVYAAKSIFSFQQQRQQQQQQQRTHQYLDADAIRSIYEQSKRSQQSSGSGSSDTVNSSNNDSKSNEGNDGNDVDVDGGSGSGTSGDKSSSLSSSLSLSELDQAILEMQHLIRCEKQRGDMLQRENRKLAREVQFAQHHISRFQFPEQVLKELGIESWEAVINEMVSQGKELMGELNQKSIGGGSESTTTTTTHNDPMDIDFADDGANHVVPTAFHHYDDPLMFGTGSSSGSGNNDTRSNSQQASMQQLLKKLGRN